MARALLGMLTFAGIIVAIFWFFVLPALTGVAKPSLP